MNRLVVVAALALSIASAAAQRPPPGEGEDQSQALGNGIFSINWGTMGLNVGMSAGPDGVLLIDAQDEPAVPRLQTMEEAVALKPTADLDPNGPTGRSAPTRSWRKSTRT